MDTYFDYYFLGTIIIYFFGGGHIMQFAGS